MSYTNNPLIEKIDNALRILIDPTVETKEMKSNDANNNIPFYEEAKVENGNDNQSQKQWFVESQLPGWNFSFEISKVFCCKQSEYQKIEIFDTFEHTIGRALILDDQIQSCTKDEFIYHESLVHPSMIAFASLMMNNKRKCNGWRVFIGGGGECSTAREVLKYKQVSKVVMCDLDKQVIDECRKYLPTMVGQNTFSDPRFELHFCSVIEYFGRYDGKENQPLFDIFIMDVCDPIECGPAISCYYQSFYQTIADKYLSPYGIFVTQSSSADLLLYHECMTVIANTVRSVFGDENMFCYSVYIPCYAAEWSFTMAFNHQRGIKNDTQARLPLWLEQFKNGKPIEYSLIDEIIDCALTNEQKIIEIQALEKNSDSKIQLKWYDGQSHMRMFFLPKFLRNALKKEQRIMTKETPFFMST